MIRYLAVLPDIIGVCEKLKSDAINMWFTNSTTKRILEETSNYYYCYTPAYLQPLTTISGIINMCDMFGIWYLEEVKKHLSRYTSLLHDPAAIRRRKDFEENIDFIIDGFKIAQDDIKKKIQLLDAEEMSRLDEAFNCYMQGCNYAAVTMAVSAIEFRLFSLMLSECPDPRLEELTLGQLIREYLSNKVKYANVIPKKHESLLTLCNIYRIFSVHPKREIITRAIATSIINMTFTFLLDEDLKRKAETKGD